MASEVTTEPAPGGGRGRVARNASIYFLAQLVSWAVSFTAVAIVPRTLGERAMGQLALANNAVHIVVSVLKCGIENFLVKEVGRDRAQTERLLGATLGLRLVAILPLTALSLLMLWVVKASPVVWMLGIIVIAACALNFLSEPLRSTLAGWEQAKKVSTADILSTSAPLFAIPFLRYGPISLAVAGLSITFVGLIQRWVWVRRQVRIAPLFQLRQWGAIIRGGLPFVVNGIAMQAYTTSTVFILRHFADERTIGVHSQGQRLYGTFLFVPTALAFALLPTLARMAHQAPEQLRAMQNRVLSLMIVLGLPVSTLMLLLAEPLCRLLYGPHKFLALPLVLQVRAFSLIPLYIITVLYQFLVAQGQQARWSLFLIGTVCLNALFCVLLIPTVRSMGYNGAVGTAAAQLLAESCNMVVALVLLKANPLTAETGGRILRAFLAAVGMGLTVWLLRNSIAALGADWMRWVTLALEVLIPAVGGLLVFAGLGWLLRILTPEEQAKLVGLVQRKFRKRRGEDLDQEAIR